MIKITLPQYMEDLTYESPLLWFLPEPHLSLFYMLLGHPANTHKVAASVL